MPGESGWLGRARKALPGGSRPSEAAPTTAAPVVGSLSAPNLLALQHSVGNRATLALMRSWAPAPTEPAPTPSGGEVVRRAWIDALKDDEQRWDEPVGGLRWYRRVTEGEETLYWYMFEGGAVAGLDPDEEGDEHPLAWWGTWAHAADHPIPGEAAAVAEPVADQPGPAPVEALADQVAVGGDAPADPAPAPEVATEHLANPAVASVRAPEYADGGMFSWPVSMTSAVAAIPVPSWIIQKVVLSIDGQAPVTFYEAFIVPAGRTTALDEDIYTDPADGDSSGTSSVRGVMQHHVFAGGAAPPGFAQGAVREADGAQYSMYAAPAFWGGGGTTHDIVVTWDDDAGDPTVVTTPAGGAFVRKADAAAFT